MMSDYRFSQEALERGRKIFKEQAATVIPQANSNLSALRGLIISGYRIISGYQEKLKLETQENREKLSVKLADEANKKLTDEFNQKVQDIQTVLSVRLNDLMEAKNAAVRSFAMLPPSDKQFKLLQALQMREGDLSDFEWQMYVEEMAGNYTASKILQKEAGKRDKTIFPPFSPEDTIDKLNQFSFAAKTAIDNIGNLDESIIGKSFVTDAPEGEGINGLIADIDSNLATIIPAERLTVLKRLKEAQQNAYDKDNVLLSSRIRVFIERNIDMLSSPEELKDALYEQAESYISQGMNATKES